MLSRFGKVSILVACFAVVLWSGSPPTAASDCDVAAEKLDTPCNAPCTWLGDYEDMCRGWCEDQGCVESPVEHSSPDLCSDACCIADGEPGEEAGSAQAEASVPGEADYWYDGETGECHRYDFADAEELPPWPRRMPCYAADYAFDCSYASPAIREPAADLDADLDEGRQAWEDACMGCCEIWNDCNDDPAAPTVDGDAVELLTSEEPAFDGDAHRDAVYREYQWYYELEESFEQPHDVAEADAAAAGTANEEPLTADAGAECDLLDEYEAYVQEESLPEAVAENTDAGQPPVEDAADEPCGGSAAADPRDETYAYEYEDGYDDYDYYDYYEYYAYEDIDQCPVEQTDSPTDVPAAASAVETEKAEAAEEDVEVAEAADVEVAEAADVEEAEAADVEEAEAVSGEAAEAEAAEEARVEPEAAEEAPVEPEAAAPAASPSEQGRVALLGLARVLDRTGRSLQGLSRQLSRLAHEQVAQAGPAGDSVKR